MSSKKKFWIIGGIVGGVVLLALIALIAWLCISSILKNIKKNTPPSWLREYAEVLQFDIDYDEVEFQIINLGEYKDSIPSLLVKYDDYWYDGGLNIYTVDKNGSLNSKYFDEDSELKILYNRETKKYEFFVYTEGYYNDSYESLMGEDKKYNVSDGKFYDENGDLKKFESLYIEATEIIGWLELEDLNTMPSRELLSILMKEKNKEKTLDTYLTDPVKKSVDKKIEQIEKEEEEERKALEEQKKKEEEEAKTTLKTKYHSLKYGTYRMFNMPEYSLEITLSPEGVCHYKGIADSDINTNYDEDCTYTVIEQEYYGVMTEFLKLSLENGGTEYFQLSRDNEFNSQWLSLEYVEE